MKIKETKYTHKVTLTHPTGKTVVRYTNKPEERTIVLLDNGYTPVEGAKTLEWVQINEPSVEPSLNDMVKQDAETVEA